jgi:F-box and WD-40 domain protein CDC4
VWQVVFEGRWCVAASNQSLGGTMQTVLDVWDFTEDEDWVADVSPESEDDGIASEDEQGELINA